MIDNNNIYLDVSIFQGSPTDQPTQKNVSPFLKYQPILIGIGCYFKIFLVTQVTQVTQEYIQVE